MPESNRANIEQLNKAIGELEKESNDLRNFNAAYAEIAKLKQDISENLKFLKQNNEGLTDISKEVEKRLVESQIKIEEIYVDNKAFQKELDGSIASRLDKHKSDIQVEIRNEAAQIKRAFETTLHSNFNQMDSKIKDAFERQEKRLQVIKVVGLIIIAICVLGILLGIVFCSVNI